MLGLDSLIADAQVIRLQMIGDPAGTHSIYRVAHLVQTSAQVIIAAVGVPSELRVIPPPPTGARAQCPAKQAHLRIRLVDRRLAMPHLKSLHFVARAIARGP